MEHKPKVLMYANKIGNKKNGAKSGMAASYTWDDPEYRILEPFMTDEMGEVGLGLDFRVRKTVAEVAKASGKDVETTKRCLEFMADAGACLVKIGRAHV